MNAANLSLALLLAAGWVPALAADVARPNVVILLADDMGFSDAGCYGGEIATPNLDTLAQDGLRFTQFYNTARCWPSRACILTGYYAQQVRRDTVPGVKSGASGERPPWARLLPEMLRPLGYRSYHSGKWHVDGKPLQNGFDHSYLLEDHDRHFAPRRHLEDDVPLPPVATNAGYYTSTAIADHAIRCLKEHAEKYAQQPFFSYVAFTVPHFPLQAPPEDVARYRSKYLRGWDVMRGERWQRMRQLGIGGSALSAIERDVGPPYDFPDDLKKLGPDEVNRPLAWEALSPAQREFQAGKMAVHAAMVDRMDREIGRILAQLRAMGALENTLIFFLSDNGASAEMMVRGDGHAPQAPLGSEATFLCLGPGWSSMANTPFRRHKTWVHEGGIATPLIVHWPRGFVARGELRHTPGHVIDLLPTILEAVGGKRFETWAGQPVPPAPGLSLLPLFARDGTVEHDSLWWQHEGNRAFRAGDWKIVAAGKDSPWELYNLHDERSESKNLAGQMPEKVRELGEAWTRQTEAYAALARQDRPPRAARPAPARKGAASGRPNILVLLADQWRAQAFGFAGDPNIRTPNLDRLQREGIRFVNAVSGVPVCCPARASLLTGQRALTHGVFLNDVELSPDAVTIAKVLREAGYDTGYIGKWHLNGDGRSAFIPRGRRQGFDYWKALECTHDYNRSFYYADGPEKQIWEGYDAIAQTRDAQQYLRERARNQKPFLLFVAWGPPHDPYATAPQKYREEYPPGKVQLRPNVPEPIRDRARTALAGYYAHCAALDDCVGDLLRTLSETGLREDTLVVFTSDHGDLLGSQGGFNKQQPYDESIRVPLVLNWPRGFGSHGRQLDSLIGTEDLMPTLLGLCRVPIPKTVQGLDYSDCLRGGRDPSDGAALVACIAPFGQWDRRHGGREFRGLRTTRYTYVRDLRGPWLLFDNQADPFQMHNLVNAPAQAGVQSELEAMLARKLKASGDEFLPAEACIKKWNYTVDANGTVPYAP